MTLGNLKMYSILQMNHPQLERKQQCLKDVLSALTKGNLLRGIEIWLGVAYKGLKSPFDNIFLGAIHKSCWNILGERRRV